MNGTFENSPTLGSQGIFVPLPDSSVTFDASNDRVVVADDPLLRPSELTLEAWVYPESGIGTNDAVLDKSTSTLRNDGYGLYHSSGNISFFVNNTSSGLVSTPLAIGQWSHVVATYDGSRLRLFIDGELQSSKVLDESIHHSTAPLRIGQGRSDTTTWTGRLDEVAIYDQALSVEQILVHYQRSPHTYADVELINEATGTSVLQIEDNLLSGGITHWTVPATIPADQQYRIRVTARDGSQPSDLSNEPFQIANDGNAYYVNIPTDSDLLDNEYTTASGNNANTGKSPDAPMATLQASLMPTTSTPVTPFTSTPATTNC